MRLNPGQRMSKYCLLHWNEYRANGVDYANEDAYKSACYNYVDELVNKYNPEAFVAITGSELDIKTLFKECIDRCAVHNKQVHVFSPAWPADYPKSDWVEHHVFQGYDHTNYHNITWMFNPVNEVHTDNEKSFGTNFSPDLLYTCYNNRPCDYRHYTIDQLAKHDLLDKGIVTARITTEFAGNSDYIGTPWEDRNVRWPFEHISIGTVLTDESEFILNGSYHFQPFVFPRSFKRGVLDIVTESRIGKDEFYLSEKTNKSLTAHKPFLVVSCANYHKWLKDDRNIEPYDEIFDYSFDSIEDDEARIRGIIDNVKRLSEEYKTPKDYKRLYETVREKTIHNFWAHMKTMVCGEKQRSVFDFIGLDSPYPDDHHTDEIINWFHNSKDGDDLDVVFFWYQFVVKPYHLKTYNSLEHDIYPHWAWLWKVEHQNFDTASI